MPYEGSVTNGKAWPTWLRIPDVSTAAFMPISRMRFALSNVDRHFDRLSQEGCAFSFGSAVAETCSHRGAPFAQMINGEGNKRKHRYSES